MFIPLGNNNLTYIPNQPVQDEVCPKCHKKEDIISVCKNCGYIYPEDEETPTWKTVVWIFIILIGVWVLVTLLSWMADYDKRTLIQMINAQGEWFVHLIHRIV
jgi:RNA polymerase subunit RPABC4/transcription elongation factor Spt4